MDRTFVEFLDDRDIGILRPLFYASQTVQGYGRLDRVPALYGLMWNTPRMMKSLQDRVAGKSGNSGSQILLTLFRFFSTFYEMWNVI